ncbi:SIR2 family protein, partial [Accumulibacter sp.]|uniref:SIR2 family NAD-dependent protein deacylase n=1 Tax=Accumulibacter sp. TaxID=2053492 RepID=UPI001AC9FA71
MPARNPPEPAAPAAAPAAATVELPIPPQLLQHLRERRLLLFAGAGLSAQAGLPTWRSLVQDVVDATIAEAMQGEESRRELESMIAAGKWLQIADHCKLKLGPGEYARLLGERLSDSGRPVPEAHRLAVRLPFAAWVTTNYDKLLERAYAEERGGLPKTLTSLDTEALGRLLFDGAPFVLKAHGDLDKPDSLVFTSRDYRDLIHGNAAFSAAFSAILLTHSVLFVGYSLADPDFNLLLDRQLLTFRGFAPERYALMSGIGKVEEEYLWRVCQIRVIHYPEGHHEAVPAFFQRLTDRLEPAPVAPVASVAPMARSCERTLSKMKRPKVSYSP